MHERQWQIDVLLVSLRSLLRGSRPDLKVVLVSNSDELPQVIDNQLTFLQMSATLDTTLFSEFFDGAPVINVPGRTFPVTKFYLEDLLEQTNHVIEEGSRCAHRDFGNRETVSMWVTTRSGEKRRETADYERNEVSDDFPNYSLATRK